MFCNHFCLDNTIKKVYSEEGCEWPFEEEKEEKEKNSKAKELNEELEVPSIPRTLTFAYGCDWMGWLEKIALGTKHLDVAGDPDHEGDDWCSVYFRRKNSKQAYLLGCDWKHLDRNEIDCHIRIFAKLGVIIEVDDGYKTATVK